MEILTIIVNYLIMLLILFLVGLLFFILREEDIPQPTQLLYPQSTKRAMSYLEMIDKDYQARVNYVLVAESMLLFSFVTTYVSGNAVLDDIRYAIAAVGIVFTVSWIAVNIRLSIQMHELQTTYLLRNDPVYWGYIKSVHRGPTAVLCLTYILPSAILLLWIYMLLFSLFEVDIYFFVEMLPFLILGIVGFELIARGLFPAEHP